MKWYIEEIILNSSDELPRFENDVSNLVQIVMFLMYIRYLPRHYQYCLENPKSMVDNNHDAAC